MTRREQRARSPSRPTSLSFGTFRQRGGLVFWTAAHRHRRLNHRPPLPLPHLFTHRATLPCSGLPLTKLGTTHPPPPPISLSLCLCLSVCLTLSLSVCLSVSVSLSVCLTLSLSVCLSVSVSLSVCLTLSVSLSVSVCLSVSPLPCLSLSLSSSSSRFSLSVSLE